MRIPYPERIPIEGAGLFAVVLCGIQLIEGTALYFSVGCFLFIVIATLAFNVAGGLTRSSGAYIFFFSILVVIVGVTYKAFLGEPGESNLRDPLRTIEVYVGGMTGMLAAAWVSKTVSKKVGVFENFLAQELMYHAGIGCCAFGIGGGLLITALGDSGRQLASAFSQLNNLMPMGIILLVLAEIRRSGGKSSLTPLALVSAGFYFTFNGVFASSKQGMITPLVCWIFPVAVTRYRVSRVQLGVVALGVFLLFYYLVPYAQYARRFNDGSEGDNWTIASKYLLHPELTRKLYLEESASESYDTTFHYYNVSQGFFDRLQFVAPDDALIDATDQNKVFGLIPIYSEAINIVPHFLWRDKPYYFFANQYAHEVGNIIPDDDVTTAISFSPMAEAYHMATWFGVLFVAPLVWMALFVGWDSLFGDVRQSPWALLGVLLLAHYAPEGALTGAIHMLTYGTMILVFAALFSVYVAPVLAIPLVGASGQQKARQRVPPRPGRPLTSGN